MPPPGVVILGGYGTALSAARALAPAVGPIAVVRLHPTDIAHHSRWVHEHVPLLDFHKHPAALLALLEEQAAAWGGRVLLPTDDLSLEILSQNREALARHYRPAAPPWEMARHYLRKDLTAAAAQAVGLDLPRPYGPATLATLNRQDIAYPVLVKPIVSQAFTAHFGSKVLVALNRSQLLRALKLLEDAGFAAQICDLIPGPDNLIYNYCAYMDKRGSLVGEVVLRKLRQSPPFYGISRVVESNVAPVFVRELRERTLALLRHTGWEGVIQAEYKRDPRDGRWRFLEMNGRCFLQTSLPLRSGCNYPLMAWQAAVHGLPQPAQSNGWPGVWIYLRPDWLYGALFRRTEGLAFRDYLATYRRPKVYPVWSARDPKPFFADWSLTLREAGQWLRSPQQRAALRRRVQPMPRVYPEP